MRRATVPGWVMVLLSLPVMLGLTGCHPAARFRTGHVGPINGDGEASLLANDSGLYRIIPVFVTGCDQAEDRAGKIYVPMNEVGMSRYQGVAWVIVRKKPVQRWTIYPKGIQPQQFNGGNPMEVRNLTSNAFFAAPPSGAGSCTDKSPCEWQYNLKVEVPISTGSTTFKECASLDPMIKIRR